MYTLEIIGFIRSELKNRENCPLQESEGAPEAWLDIAPAFKQGLENITVGSELLLFTWLHLADRSVLKCYMRNQKESPQVGVFATRSPDRPNPIGLHRVKVLEIVDGSSVKVFPLEALDDTPLIDIKPVLV